MIINVKATKATGPEGSSNPYILTEKKPSRAPVVLSLLLTGMALYLKSVFPGWAQEASDSRPEPEPEDPKSAPKLVLIPSENVLDPAFDSRPAGGTHVASGGGQVVAGGQLLDHQPTSFMVIESPEIEQLEISVPQIVLPVPSIAPSGPRPANDNGAPHASSAGGSGNSTEETEPPDDVPNSDGDLDSGGSHTADPDEIDLDDYTNPFYDEDDGYLGEEDDDDDGTGNRAPRVTGPVYLHDVFSGMAAVIGLSELLRNASDPDDGALSIANLTVSSGTLIQTADGWTLSDGMLGPITLTYEITDGALSIVQHAYLNVLKNPAMFGTPGSDVLVGTEYADDIDGGGSDDNIEGHGGDDTIGGAAGNDLIVAGSGNDLVRGGDGNDIVFGGLGMDSLSGGKGDDQLFGGDGDDVIFGDDGDDVLHGEDGDDRLFSGAGDDLALGGAGHDFLDGGDGDDTLSGGGGDDTLLGGGGSDLLEGGDGNDLLSGQEGDDLIADGGGRDTVDAGDGDDTIVAALDAAADDYDGGDGTDTLDYSATRSGVLINLNEQTATGIEVGTDTISGFEAIIGGAGDDHFVITDAPVSLQGGEGNDLFEFEAVTGTSAGAQVVHDILDFMVGDRIKVSKYEIFNEVIGSLEDQFEDIYGNEAAKDELPIRIRHEQTDNIRQTLIDVDFDQDQIYEMTIAISGDHVLMVVDNAQPV